MASRFVKRKKKNVTRSHLPFSREGRGSPSGLPTPSCASEEMRDELIRIIIIIKKKNKNQPTLCILIVTVAAVSQRSGRDRSAPVPPARREHRPGRTPRTVRADLDCCRGPGPGRERATLRWAPAARWASQGLFRRLPGHPGARRAEGSGPPSAARLLRAGAWKRDKARELERQAGRDGLREPARRAVANDKRERGGRQSRGRAGREGDGEEGKGWKGKRRGAAD